MLRRVVTGTDSEGAAFFADDSTLTARSASALPGVEMHYIWGADQRRLPSDGSEPSWHSHFPPESGLRFVLLTLQPGQAAAPVDSPTEAQLNELQESFPGLLGTIEPDTEGMHTSATVDFAVVLSGPITLELSDTLAKELQAGDVVVQAGNVHRWVNRGSEPAVVAAVVVGATYEGGTAPS
ncbi:cupin domain-containing protein [Amycolatopsis endophytica]|uniref:Quercetin dioxygenase-like cupin family protein n=1 Tax=Amycolatopsis endophytica TaxID=860233 RepID=A0A853BCM2_9PSEU|nr:cupin domain-containing protein [Amycolatopsis endophytica]NYI92146.1 quercetin dioxygenase-like cupin family protein [Amycolatopsis endophytica]